MPDILDKILLFGSNAVWVPQVFAVILTTLLTAYIVSICLGRLQIRFQKTQNMWDDALVFSIKRPLQFLIWTFGISFAVEIIYQESGAKIFSVMHPIKDIIVISIISWFAIRFIINIQDNVIAKALNNNKPIDRSTIDALSVILRAAVIITAILTAMQSFGFSMSGILAFGGIGGVAIGFAAKDMLANFFGALMIYFDRPFQVGDWIRSPDKEIEGTVEDIGWRQTRIRTFEKRPLYVPNSVFSTISVENPSRMTHRRIKESLGIRYQDIYIADKIAAQIRQYLLEHSQVDKEQTLIVNLHQFGNSTVDLLVQACVFPVDIMPFHAVKHEIIMKVIEIIRENGAELAYPTNIEVQVESEKYKNLFQ